MHIFAKKLLTKTKLSTLKNVWLQSFYFFIFRSVRYTWARGQVGHVGRVGTWARWARHLADSSCK